MSTTATPRRRRAWVTATAALTAVVTIAGLGFLGLTTSPPVASAAQSEVTGSDVGAPALELEPPATEPPATEPAPQPTAAAEAPAATTATSTCSPTTWTGTSSSRCRAWRR
jgi:hypothetical protein